MSSLLQVEFSTDMPVATIEVLNEQWESIDRFMMRPGNQRSLSVNADRPLLRVHLGTGNPVTLRRRDSGHYLITRDELRRRQDPSRPRSLAPLQADFQLRMGQTKGLLGTNIGVVREELLWDVPPAPDVPDDAPVQWMDVDHPPAISPTPNGFRYEPMKQERPLQLQLRVGRRRLALRLPGNTREVTVDLGQRAWNRSTPEPDLVRVSMATRNADADTLAGFMQRGDFLGAEAMTAWINDAAEMLTEKERDPYSAVVGAYLLLRLERYDQMRDWARNLANWFPFLADGAIVWAWQALRQKQDVQEAEKYFLQAAAGELPLHTEGIRLLSEGLSLLANKTEESSEPGKPTCAADDALRALGRKTNRVIWRSPFTATWLDPREKSGDSPPAAPKVEIRYLAME